MSRHAVYLSSILVVLMTVAQAPAQDHVWPAVNLDDDGTSPNQGRMIDWSPAPPWAPLQIPWVHATWVDNDVTWYSYSPDCGVSWDPAMLVPSSRPSSYGPALRALPDGSVWVCKEAIDDTSYRWECAVRQLGPWTLSNVPLRDTTVRFRKFPVATAISTTSGIPMVYMVTTVVDPRSPVCPYRLYFLAFDLAWPDVQVWYDTALDVWSSSDLQPSIDYMPGDVVHIVYRDGNNIIQERRWADPGCTPDSIRHVPEITIAWNLCPGDLYRVSREGDPRQEPGSQPFIDWYGEWGYCVWRGRRYSAQDFGEIWWADYYRWQPGHWWQDQVPKSESPNLESDRPQCFTGSTVFWREQVLGPPVHTEIYANVAGTIVCISDAPDTNNWGPQASFPPAFGCPPPPPPTFRCHVLWSQKEITGGGERIHYKRCDIVPPAFAGVEYPTYLKPTLGKVKPSPYCLERDGYVDYGNYWVDYGKSRLVYDLPCLDPASDYFAQFTLFNGESLPVTQSVKLGGIAVAQKTLRPGVCETLYAYIPRAAYKTTHARLEVTRLSGPFACLANDVRVYETYRTREPGGALAQTGPAEPRGLRARPSPFNSRTVITFDGASPGSVFRIYDASGRLVRSLRADGRQLQGCAAVWDGTDKDGRALPAGVYTCTCATGSAVSSVRVIRQ